MGTRKLVVAGGNTKTGNIDAIVELDNIIKEMNTDSDKPAGLTFGDERSREVRNANVSCAFCFVDVGDSITNSQSFLSKHGFQSMGDDFIINVGEIFKRAFA